MEITTDFKAKKAYEGVNLKCARDKYAQILSIFFQICPKNVFRQHFQTTFSAHTLGNFSRKIGLLPKSNNFFTNIEKFPWGNKVELVG